MSLTQDESRMLERREELDEHERAVVDETMDEMRSWGRAGNVPLAVDDRAAKVEAAIIKYVIDSREK